MAKTKSNNDKREQENREKVKLRVRKYRQALKYNPEKHEEVKRLERERYQRRKEQSKIKAIDDLTLGSRERCEKIGDLGVRKVMRKKRQVHPILEHLDNLKAMRLHSACQNTVNNTMQTLCKPLRKNNRYPKRLQLQKLKEELKNEKAKKEKYKKRLYRNRYAGTGADRDSPISNAERMIEGQTLTTKVKQALRFGAVLSTQIKENV
nr:unnamed protein product [Callosobruchus analis]